MKQFLQKVFELMRRVVAVAGLMGTQLVRFLRAVDIDLPRGVILCITFQLLLVLALILAFRVKLFGPVQALSGTERAEPTSVME